MKIPEWIRRGGSERGSATLEFLILVPMLVFLAFYPINTYIFQLQRNHLDSVKDRYLQEAQLAGGFTTELWDAIQTELQARKFDLTKLDFTGSTPVGVVKHRGEPIILKIGYPQGNTQAIISLIGLQPPDPAAKMWVVGSILSEKP